MQDYRPGELLIPAPLWPHFLTASKTLPELFPASLSVWQWRPQHSLGHLKPCIPVATASGPFTSEILLRHSSFLLHRFGWDPHHLPSVLLWQLSFLSLLSFTTLTKFSKKTESDALVTCIKYSVVAVWIKAIFFILPCEICLYGAIYIKLPKYNLILSDTLSWTLLHRNKFSAAFHVLSFLQFFASCEFHFFFLSAWSLLTNNCVLTMFQEIWLECFLP